MFNNRRVAIATMHAKESVIAPMLEKAFKASCFVPENLNTDTLGTFSGEIERIDNPLATARKKCSLAMDKTNTDLAIANEGSFGAHPSLFLAHADDEIVLLVDRKNDLEIFGRKISTNTNFSGTEVQTIEEATDFANKVDFPSHGLIIRNENKSISYLHKGITEAPRFKSLIAKTISEYGKAWIETDMRAMHNPTRMQVIGQATQNLISKLQSCCPACNHPGYWISKQIKGLPCALCTMPTNAILANEYSCIKCNQTEQKQYPNAIKVEDPTYCNFCNP